MKCAFFILFLGFTISAFSQKEAKNLSFGFKSGVTYSSISDLSKVIVSESYYTGYSFNNKGKWGYTGGIFLNNKFEETISAIYTELSYAQLGNVLHYSDVKGLNYDITMKYQYVNWELLYKAYIYKGLHIGFGPRMGFNLSPSALFYKSNKEDLYGPDIRIQQQMRDVLKGRTNFAFGITTGWEFEGGFSFDFRYYYGLSDVVETEVNNFKFIENKNNNSYLQFTIGYAIPYTFNFF